MRSAKTICMMMIGLFFFASAGLGADAAKIGIVDFQKILETSSAGKSAQAEIKKRGKQMEEDLKAKGSAIEEKRKQFEREAMVLSEQAREEKERELRIGVGDFKSLQKKYAEEFKELEGKLIVDIQKGLIELVNDFGKKGGYLLILERRETGVLYSPQSIDITDVIIEQFNKKFAKTSQ